MKDSILWSRFMLPALAAWSLLVGTGAQAAVTFTVTPAAVSNTHSGIITLQVAGLAGGDSVVVQKFIDLNTNGVIDASDQLVQQFTLTDGQAGMVISGVTNLNVPGDTAPTAGQIIANLNFKYGPSGLNPVGTFLYKLSSPSGNFTPITNLFSITNLPYAQKITGTTLPNAVVMLFPPPQAGGKGGPGGSPVAGVVANNSGSYSIPAPPGTYMLAAFKGSYLVNFSTAPVLTLGSGATVNTNLTLTAATASISGRLVDSANSSLGLPGVQLNASSDSGLMGFGYSDTNGNFTLGVQSGQWNVQVDESGLILHGYVSPMNGSTVSAGTTGMTLAVPKATALIYGSVKDVSSNAMVGIDIYLGDNYAPNLYQTDAYTDTNGNYVAAVVGGLGTNQVWFPEISTANNNANPTNYLFTQSQLNGNVNSGAAVLQNFSAMIATNHIYGNVSFNSTNVVGVGVQANQNINGANFWTWAHTDASGNYILNVGNGTWDVGVYTTASGYGDDLDTLLGVGIYASPADQWPTLNNSNATINFAVQSAQNASPVLTAPVWLGNGQFQFSFNPLSSVNYTVQYSTNLGSTDWTTLLITNNAAANSFVVLDPGATNSARFYRVLIGP